MKPAIRLLTLLSRGGPSYEAPAYANTGGTGDRTAIITVSETLAGTGASSLLVNGLFANTKFWNNQTAAGKVVKFDFGAAKLITEAKWYQNAAQSQGVWKWQGSTNDSVWVDIGTSFTLGASAATETLTELSGNTTGYRYYRLLGVSGNASNATYQREIEFKIGSLL